MKKTDIAMIILIAGFSVLIAYVIVNSLVSGLKTSPVDVPTAKPISSDVTKPDPSIFSGADNNPTVQTNIGQSN